MILTKDLMPLLFICPNKRVIVHKLHTILCPEKAIRTLLKLNTLLCNVYCIQEKEG